MDHRSTVPGPDYRVLGPVEVVVDGTQVRVPAGTQRSLLAALLLSRGRAVTVGRLLDLLWDEEQPQDPRAALHTAVARLRKRLAAAGIALHTVTAGYALEVPAMSLDADRFSDLHARARALLGDSSRIDPGSSAASDAAVLLRSALDLWRGPAWGELADGVASGEALRLEEARLAAREDLATALLRSGHSGEAVATLESLVLENPLRDRAVGLLVDALHRYGRTADALSTFAAYRERLADELGLDPSPALAALHQRVLRQELPEAAVVSSPPAPSRTTTARRSRPSRTVVGGLVGRDEDATALSHLLGTAGLVTLVGPGGVGKSRLAQQVGESMDESLRWVDLVPVRDRAGVVQAIADALDIEPGPGRAVEDAVRKRLSSSSELVVLDNCEHVLDAVAAVLSTVVNPLSTVLATSRERLGLTGEQVFVLEPLRLPQPGEADPHAPAVELFLLRARDAGADLGNDDEVVRRVGEVCRALDGLPLALELAAARMGTLTLDDLAERLDSRFDLLTRGPRTAARRHRTLRSVVDWSYDLLDEDERTVFTRLSVFPSGFDLAAAEAVVADDELPAACIADVVAQLAERSMVVRPGGTGHGKYRLLDSLRQYAASRLRPEELAAMRRRHALWAVELAEAARVGLEGPDEARWARLLDDVLEDLRAAWRWSLDAEDLRTGGRLVAATWRWAHWRLRADVLAWGYRLLSGREADVPLVAYTAAIGGAWMEGRLDDAEQLGALAAGLDADESDRADLREVLSDARAWRSEVRSALDGYTYAEQVHTARCDWVRASIVSSNKLNALSYAGLPRDEAIDRVLALAAATDNPSAIAFARFAEGEACAEDDVPRALRAFEEALRLAETVGNRLVTGVAMTAQVSLLGRSTAVEPGTFDLFRRVVTHWAATENPALLVTALRNLVILLGRVGRDEEAVELWAALNRIDAVHPSYGVEAERLDATLEGARTRLGPAFDAAVLRGRDNVGLADVASLALKLCEDGVATSATAPVP